MMWFSIALVVVGNILYHLGQRAIPRDSNAVVATLAAYLIATMVTLATIPFLARGVEFSTAWQKLDGSTLLVGFGIVGVELGFLLVYRAGWTLGTASLVASAMVAVILLAIGAIAFREEVTASRIGGVVLCLTGLWLVVRPAHAA